jgi:hypothetical protein
MVILPYELDAQSVVFVIIEKHNLDIMKTGNPIKLMGSPSFLKLKHPDCLQLIIAYEDQKGMQKVHQLMEENRFREVIQHITRGILQAVPGGKSVHMIVKG